MVKKKEYSNSEITVVWQPELCIHSGVCFKGLPRVFQPRVRPWIKIDGATTEAIVNQVKACPSGALSYFRNADRNIEEEPLETKVTVRENGPLLVHGTLKITHKDGKEEIKKKLTAFCRCGASNNKPYCDGTHNKNGFMG
jgi:uncharacterized Fe-S cluster protein YjdI